MRSLAWRPDRPLSDEDVAKINSAVDRAQEKQTAQKLEIVAFGTISSGKSSLLNALAGKYCDWSGLVDLAPKPPVLWTHGAADIVVADGSAWEMGTLVHDQGTFSGMGICGR